MHAMQRHAAAHTEKANTTNGRSAQSALGGEQDTAERSNRLREGHAKAQRRGAEGRRKSATAAGVVTQARRRQRAQHGA